MSEKKSNAEELKRMHLYYDKNWVKAIEIAKKLLKKEEIDSLWSLAHSELLYCYAKNGSIDDVIRFGEVFLTKPIRAYNKLGVVEQLVSAYWTKECYECICNLAKEAIQLLHSVVAEDLILEEVQYYGEYYLHSSLTSKMTAYIMVAALMECDQEVVDLLKNDGMDLVEEAFEEPVIGEWICDSFNTLNFDEERCRMIGILSPQKYLDRFDLDKYSGVEVDDTVYDKAEEKEEWELFMRRVEDVGFIDLRDCIIDFPKEYFEGEERDGFYIEPMMKNAWAGNLEVLYKVDILCQALDIPYFVNWGTMLGAVRHKGYIPWDDDLDIGVLRKDYEKLKFAVQYCQDELEFYDNYNEGDWGAHAAKITNAVDFILNREKIKRYHGFSFFSSIDVFVIDTVPRDKRLEKEQYDIICLIREVIHRRDEVKDVDPESAEYKKYKKVEQSQIATIQKLCQMEFEQEYPSNQELFILSDEVMGLYPEAQSDYYTVPHRLANGQDYYIPKEVFSEMIRMSFEGIEVNVPVGYDFILRKNYGDDYMIPINKGGGHGYPFYSSVIESLVEDRSKKHTREETLEYIKKVSYGYYHDFLHQTNDTSCSFSEDYFVEEIIEGKVVSEELKRIQAAELEIYAEITRICEKKGIKCYALGDTINGAKDYQGFVPGTEGIHIGMKRPDYVTFFNCLCEELDTWFTYESIFLDERHTDLRTYIMTDAYGVKDEDYIVRFHGCTDIVAVDVSPLDCVDLNKEVDEVRKNLVTALLRTAATLPDKGPYSDETYELIDEWTKGLEISIKKEGNLRQNVLRTVDAVASSYSGECDFYRVSPDLQVDMDVKYSCESLETAQEMKFGPCKILVPIED